MRVVYRILFVFLGLSSLKNAAADRFILVISRLHIAYLTYTMQFLLIWRISSFADYYTINLSENISHTYDDMMNIIADL